jgi:drug/metabolite transporter (DMT)-like permease
MKILKQPLPWQVGLVLVAGVFAVSTAAIFIRLAIASAGVRGVGFSLFLSASRLAIASLLLLPAWRNLKPSQLSPGALRYAAAAGICLAAHFATWITSLSFTSIAASTTLVTTNPVWVALLCWLWFKEKLTRLTVVGIGVAFVGGVLIALGDTGAVSAGNNPALGNFLALVGAWMASLYFLLGREAQRRGLGIGSYVVVAYSTGALVLLPLPLIVGSNYVGYPVAVYAYILLMAVLSQVVGHTTLNWAVRWISPTLVTLAILFEPVGSSFLGYLIFNEVPGLLVLVGAGVLLSGVAIAIAGR